MISCEYAVLDKQGPHTTSAMSLCRTASNYGDSIALKGERKSTDYKNVLALVSLGTYQGECLELLVEGPDEGQTAGFLQGLMCMTLRSMRMTSRFPNCQEVSLPPFSIWVGYIDDSILDPAAGQPI